MRCCCPTDLPASRSTPRPISSALLSTRQRAEEFNQPLSFDTSRVTDMRSMLRVHFARVSCSHTDSSRALPCTLHARPPPHRPSSPPPRPPTAAPHRMAPFCLAAGSEGIQPAAKLRHVQRHRNGRNAQGAPPRLYPAPRFQSSLSSHAACADAAARRPSRIVYRTPFRLGSARRRSTSR